MTSIGVVKRTSKDVGNVKTEEIVFVSLDFKKAFAIILESSSTLPNSDWHEIPYETVCDDNVICGNYGFANYSLAIVGLTLGNPVRANELIAWLFFDE